jgi:hypothetical protein
MKLPQLTLRDLFWLVLVVAILCGWWVDRTIIRTELLTEIGKHHDNGQLLKEYLQAMTAAIERQGYRVDHKSRWGETPDIRLNKLPAP